MSSFKELNELGKELQVLRHERIYNIKNLPLKMKKEIAFVGKSNVGKSSLINTLLNYNLNRVSKKPGCTKWIGYIELTNSMLIDLPGYGYANVSKQRQEFWQDMIMSYINIKRIDTVLLLIDSRRGITQTDKEVASLFLNCKVKYIFTKSDEKDAKHNDIGFNASIRNGKDILEIRKIIA